MKKRWLLWVRNLAVRLFQLVGSDISDALTGEKLARCLLIAWGGKIHVLGDSAALVPLPIFQRRLTYWHQEIGFTKHPSPDFSRSLANAERLAQSPFRKFPQKTLLVILDHRSADQVLANLQRWTEFIPANQILLAYGGTSERFSELEWSQKVLIRDPRLRVKDLQRDGHSYFVLMQEVTAWLAGRDFSHVLFMEFDQVAIDPDLLNRYLNRMTAEDADVLGYWLRRLDGTTHPHWLSLAEASRGEDMILSMIGTGHFWKREAWEAVSNSNVASELYCELHLPSAAHQLGFRVRGIEDQEKFVVARVEDRKITPDEAIAAGAWTLHPVK